MKFESKEPAWPVLDDLFGSAEELAAIVSHGKAGFRPWLPRIRKLALKNAHSPWRKWLAGDILQELQQSAGKSHSTKNVEAWLERKNA